jgi:NCS1 family nucleobase:cation symporter-1
MPQFVQQMKDAGRSPKSFRELLQTSSSDGPVRYNKDLLPSPPGTIGSILKSLEDIDTDTR